MEIVWYGLSCFRLAERGFATVVTDPYDYRPAGAGPMALSAEILTLSHAVTGEPPVDAIQGEPYRITGPGEYEVGGVFITGIQTGGQKTTGIGTETAPVAIANTLYVFDFNSLTVAHLGGLDRLLTQSEVEAVGTVNVALVPIGSSRGLNASRAAEVISLLEPNIVIPMYEDAPGSHSTLDALSKFLKEMGLSEVVKQPSLKITSTALPEEIQVIVLDQQRG